MARVPNRGTLSLELSDVVALSDAGSGAPWLGRAPRATRDGEQRDDLRDGNRLLGLGDWPVIPPRVGGLSPSYFRRYIRIDGPLVKLSKGGVGALAVSQ